MKIVVELSGGADSALAAVYATRRYVDSDFFALFVDYGQSYAIQEKEASEKVFKHLKDKFGGWYWNGITVSKFWQQGKAIEEYVPLRNLMLSSIAASYAQSIGAEIIVTGSKSLVVDESDPYSFRDSTLEFYKLLEQTLTYATEKGIRLVRIEPLLAMYRDTKMTKRQVYKQLEELGITGTWSCYHPTVAGEECGDCKNCKEKLEILGIKK